jgi:hypothetical protein
MRFSWLLFAKGELDLYEKVRSSQYFQVSRNPGFLKPLGIVANRAYRPWLISPQIDVWQEVERKINRETKGSARGRSPVLHLRDSATGPERRYSFAIRLYRPNLICLEVKLIEEFPLDLDEAFVVKNLDTHTAAKTVADALIGMITSGHIRGYPLLNSFFYKPAILLPTALSAVDFADWKQNSKSAVTGLLINNLNYSYADAGLADKIFDRNKEVDIKHSQAAFSLISKQGVLTSFAREDERFTKHMSAEHLKRFRFLEFALAIQGFLQELPTVRQEDEDIADFLLYLCMPYISGATTLAKTVTGTYTWQILSRELGLEQSLEAVEKPVLDAVERKMPLFLKIPQENYDSLDFKQEVHSVTRSLKARISRDFEGRKVLPWAVATAVAAVAAAATIAKLFSHA